MATTITQTPSATGLTDISGLMKSLTGERQQLYGQGLNILQQIATMMQGPEFDKYAEEMYESAKRKAVGAGTSRLISSGLMGTTRAVEPEQSFEREVGTPFRLGLAEQKTGRIATALGNIANYMQGFAPSAGTLAYLATGGFGQLSPEQKLAAGELPYLMQAAQQGGGGTGFMGSTTGGGGGGGGGSISRPSYGDILSGTSSGYSSGTTGSGAQVGVQRYSGGTEQPTTTSGYQEGSSWYGPNAPGGTGAATYIGGQWVPEGLSNLTQAAQAEPATFPGGGGGQFGGTGYTGVWGDPTGGTLATSQPGAEVSGANTPTGYTDAYGRPITDANVIAAMKAAGYAPGERPSASDIQRAVAYEKAYKKITGG